MKDRILSYNGKYGKLTINLDTHIVNDQLDHELIWQESNNCSMQQVIYSEILDDAGIAKYAPPISDDTFWNGYESDFGFVAVLEDGEEIMLDHEGVHFI